MENSGYANNNFAYTVLAGDCLDGTVTNGSDGDPGPACPFPVGSGLNSKYNGDYIIEIVSGTTSGCIGTDYAGFANVGPCPDYTGGAGSNIWVIGPECDNDTGNYFINVYWSGQHSDADASSLISGGSIGAQAYVAFNDPTASCWAPS